MKRLRGKLTYSNVVSTLCPVLLLGGGTAYAAAHLPKNSVGSKQIRRGAITPSKLSSSSKRSLVGPAGPKGDQGERGPVGPQGIPGLTGDAPLVLDLGAGEIPGMNQEATVGVPLTGGSSWTPAAGQAGLLFGKVTATLGFTGGVANCAIQVNVFDNGRSVRGIPLGTNETSLTEFSANLDPVVIAIDEPGVHTISATASGSSLCLAGSKIDSVHLMVAPLG